VGAEPNEEAVLGPERSVHQARIAAALVPAAIAVATILLAGLAVTPSLGWVALALVSPFAAAAGMLLGLGPLGLRGARVVLHERGIVVYAHGARDVVPFSDVRDVWWEGLWTGAYFARISALRLVDGEDRAHRVPLQVERADGVVRWVDRHCSANLMPDARTAFRAGETLTFGPVSFDRDVVRFEGVRCPWTRIRLVRLLPGRVAFFRWIPIFPWKTVRLDRVPHPFLFVRLLRDAAPKVEVHPPIADE
jgi:hypothetical protein